MQWASDPCQKVLLVAFKSACLLLLPGRRGRQGYINPTKTPWKSTLNLTEDFSLVSVKFFLLQGFKCYLKFSQLSLMVLCLCPFSSNLHGMGTSCAKEGFL